MKLHQTWADIEKAALNDAFLHAAVTLVRQGHLTREEALIAAALGLSDARQRLLEHTAELRACLPSESLLVTKR